jgi:hypothetical protein
VSHARALLVAIVSASVGAMLGRGGIVEQPYAVAVCAGACALLFVTVTIELLKGGHGPILREQLDRIEARVAASESVKMDALAVVEGEVVALKIAVNQLVKQRLVESGAGRTSTTGNYPAAHDT